MFDYLREIVIEPAVSLLATLAVVLRATAMVVSVLLFSGALGCGSGAQTGTHSQFSQGMVSINFDDGHLSAFNNAIPILDAAGLKSTNYIITGRLGSPGYIAVADVLTLQVRGHELGAHTRTHADLTTVTADQLSAEVAGSRQDLIAVGVAADTFAYPSGRYNDAVVEAVRNAGYIAARTTIAGLDTPADDRFRLKCEVVLNTTTEDEVQSWINSAVRDRTWLVLLFHEVDQSTYQYSTTPQFFQHVIDYLVLKQVPTVSMSQGYKLMQSN